MTFDSTTVIPFPDSAAWAANYAKMRRPLVNSLNHDYCLADREDAVEEAFHKLMHKKDAEAYGENMPQTEADWFGALRWQAKSFLSHMKERSARHAKYVERAAKDVFAAFAPVQGFSLDAEARRRALVRALEILRAEQDISRRNLEVYVNLETGSESVKSLCARHKITENNAYAIRFRMKNLLRKHGPACYRRALQIEAREPHFDDAA